MSLLTDLKCHSKIAAAEGVGADELEQAMRTENSKGKRETLLELLTELLPPDRAGAATATPAEVTVADDGDGGSRDTFHAFVLLANIIDKGSGRVLLTLMQMKPESMAVLFDFFDAIFAAELPQLHAHFEDVGIVPQLYLIEWLYTLYAKPLPQCVTAWIWDHVFAFGDRFLFQSALGLLKLLEPHLLLQDDMILGKLLKTIPQTRQQFEGGTYPPEVRTSFPSCPACQCFGAFVCVLVCVCEPV